EQLKKQKKENRKKEMMRVMFHNVTRKMGLQDLSMMDLNNLTYMIDHHLIGHPQEDKDDCQE
ncbi:hypothetical protein TorRG33x02_339380, partial [Trema orientale]